MSSYRYDVQRADLRARLLPNVAKGKIRQENNLIAELFEKYPDQGFWRGFTPPQPIETFADLFAAQGKAVLQRAWTAFHFSPPALPPRYVLVSANLGTDRVIKTKPRTLREFLNG